MQSSQSIQSFCDNYNIHNFTQYSLKSNVNFDAKDQSKSHKCHHAIPFKPHTMHRHFHEYNVNRFVFVSVIISIYFRILISLDFYFIIFFALAPLVAIFESFHNRLHIPSATSRSWDICRSIRYISNTKMFTCSLPENVMPRILWTELKYTGD